MVVKLYTYMHFCGQKEYSYAIFFSFQGTSHLQAKNV